MKVWIVFTAQWVAGVFTTERKAKAFAELLDRNKIVTSVTMQILNEEVQKSDGTKG